MDWFLYDRELVHVRVKGLTESVELCSRESKSEFPDSRLVFPTT